MAQLPSGPFLDYDANVLDLEAGDPVTAWPNLGSAGSSWDLTEITGTPTLQFTDLGAVVRMDGDVLKGADVTKVDHDGQTILAVGFWRGYGEAFFENNGAFVFNDPADEAGGIAVYVGAITQVSVTPPLERGYLALTAGDSVLVAADCIEDTDPQDGPFNAGKFFIDGNWDAARILAYDRQFTDDEWEQARAWASHTYGLSLECVEAPITPAFSQAVKTLRVQRVRGEPTSAQHSARISGSGSYW